MSIRNLSSINFKRVSACFISALLIHVPFSAYAQVANQETVYTYTADGLIETQDGPRPIGDASDITRHEYDPTTRYLNKTISAWGSPVAQAEEYLDHNGRGLPETIVDPNGIQTKLEYHPRGWLTKVTIKHPTNTSLDSVTEYKYNGRGERICEISPEGDKTIMLYNAAGHMEGKIEGANNCDTTLNSSGFLKKYTLNANGDIETETYYQGLSETDPVTYVVTRDYDELGRVMDVTGNNGQNTHFDYDGNGFITKQIETKNASGGTRQTEYTPDNHGRLKITKDAHGNDTVNHYTNQDEMDKVTDARTNETDYDYDAYGNVETLDSPDAGFESFKYDEANNLTHVYADAAQNNLKRSYTYDALNRVTSISYPNNTAENVTYYYDNYSMDPPFDWWAPVIPHYPIGRLTGIDHEHGKIRYYYDERGNVIQQNDTIINVEFDGAQVLVTHYTYRLDNQVKTITYPTGLIATYDYNSQARVNRITVNYSGRESHTQNQVHVVVDNVEYMPFGPAKKIVYGNGITVEKDYDNDYRLDVVRIKENGTIIEHFDYEYDHVNHIVDIINVLDSTKNFNYGYDDLDRLTSENSAALQHLNLDPRNLVYQYDAVGNRTSFTYEENGPYFPFWNLFYELGSNRITNIAHNVGASPDGYSYDDEGNIFKRNRQKAELNCDVDYWDEFDYNEAGRMVKANVKYERVCGDSEWDSNQDHYYRYNPLGLRTQKRLFRDWVLNNGTRYTYGYNLQGQLIYEAHVHVVSNTVAFSGLPRLKQWIYLNGEPIAQFTEIEDYDEEGNYEDPKLSTFYVNHVGVPALGYDENGVNNWDIIQDAFGKLARTRNSNGVQPTHSPLPPFRFAGQYYDFETQLHYNWHRYYDPYTGRYLTSDPLGLEGGINTYVYSLNSPSKYTDPLGLEPFDPGKPPADPTPNHPARPIPLPLVQPIVIPWKPPAFDIAKYCPPYFNVGNGLIPLVKEKKVACHVFCNYHGWVTRSLDLQSQTHTYNNYHKFVHIELTEEECEECED